MSDCRSLYDLLVRDGSLATVSEKRTAIDVAGIVDMLHELQESNAHDPENEIDLRSIVKWVPTKLLAADYFTKVHKAATIRSFLNAGRLRVRGTADDLKICNFCRCVRLNG